MIITYDLWYLLSKMVKPIWIGLSKKAFLCLTLTYQYSMKTVTKEKLKVPGLSSH